MNARWCALFLGTAALISASSACRPRANAPVDLAQLQQTFPTQAGSNDSAGEAGAYVNAALAAVRQNDFAGGVMALQTVQQLPQLSPEQLQSVHAAMQSLTATLVERAARGDAKARADLAAIERTRSQ